MKVPASSVIIVSYQPGTWLESCIRSVAEQADEVIVVDNGSAGRRASAAARAVGAVAVPCRRNLGFAGGVEAGLAHARGDLVAVLNDDAVAGPGWLDSAAAVLEDPDVAAVTPKVRLAGWFAEVLLPDAAWYAPGDPRPLGRQVRSVTADGREVADRCVGAGLYEVVVDDTGRWRWTGGGLPFYVPLPERGAEVAVDGEPAVVRSEVRVLNHAGSFLRAHGVAGEYGLGAPDDGRFDLPGERFGFSGTAPVFRAATLRRLGAFAPQYFAYNEDTDWCLRARLAGLRILYDPGAVVEHRLSATSGGVTALFVQRLAQRNALLCMVRNGPAGAARREVANRLRWDWRGPVGRGLLAKLPWALASRRRLSAGWRLSPEEVWETWAERDTTWDVSPAR